MKWWIATIAAAVILLLLADFLAFHDLFESHTVRDWMMLAATGLIVVGLVGVIARDRRVSAG
jgi:protein-S-isoprenylcysteine O-methyltransferase Ste14